MVEFKVDLRKDFTFSDSAEILVSKIENSIDGYETLNSQEIAQDLRKLSDFVRDGNHCTLRQDMNPKKHKPVERSHIIRRDAEVIDKLVQIQQEREKLAKVRAETKSEYLADPLKDITRKERRNLIFVSFLAITFVAFSIKFSKIPVLGVDIPNNNGLEVPALTAMIIYFGFSFVVYGLADFRNYGIVKNEFETNDKRVIDCLRDYIRARILTKLELSDTVSKSLFQSFMERDETINIWKKGDRDLWGVVKRNVVFPALDRVIVDFYLPIALAFVALCLIWIYG